MKPAGGYPSQRQAIRALLGEGRAPKAIAAELGCTVGYVRVVMCKSGFGHSWYVVAPVTLRAALAEHAEARGLSPTELALRILSVVTREELVDAVLDDHAEPARVAAE